MQININLENTVAAALEKALSPDTVRTKVEEAVAKVVDKAISDAFSTYGDFSTTVKKSVAELLPHSVDIEGAANFNHAINQAITTRLKQVNDERIQQAIEPMLEELFKPAPAEVTLSALIETALASWRSEYERKGSRKPYVLVEKTTGIVAGYHHIFIDPDGSKASEYSFSKYKARVQIDVNDKGEVYGLKISGSDIRNMIFAGPFFNFDRHLFQLYTQKTRLIVDCVDFSDVSYTSEDYDD